MIIPYSSKLYLNFEVTFLVLPEKSHEIKIESKLLVVMEFFQNNIFLLCDLLVNITYFYTKTQGNFQCCTFFQFWAFLLIFITILARDHMEIWFYIKYAHLKEHISAFEKILSFGQWVIFPLKHCISGKKLNFSWLYLLIPDRSHDSLNQIC